MGNPANAGFSFSRPVSRIVLRVARGEDHREGAALLRQIVPGGDRAAKALVDLLNLKDTAQYGLIPITRRELATTLRRARTVLDFAGDVLRR
jgi:hypothetical protein